MAKTRAGTKKPAKKSAAKAAKSAPAAKKKKTLASAAKKGVRALKKAAASIKKAATKTKKKKAPAAAKKAKAAAKPAKAAPKKKVAAKTAPAKKKAATKPAKAAPPKKKTEKAAAPKEMAAAPKKQAAPPKAAAAEAAPAVAAPKSAPPKSAPPKAAPPKVDGKSNAKPRKASSEDVDIDFETGEETQLSGASVRATTATGEPIPAHPDAQLTQRQVQLLHEKLVTERLRVVDGFERHLQDALGENEVMPDETDMAQRSTEQAYLIRFADKERKLLTEIDHALEKMRLGDYGVCEGTEEPIGFKRLELRPWTRYSVAYKEQIERERMQHRR